MVRCRAALRARWLRQTSGSRGVRRRDTLPPAQRASVTGEILGCIRRVEASGVNASPQRTRERSSRGATRESGLSGPATAAGSRQPVLRHDCECGQCIRSSALVGGSAGTSRNEPPTTGQRGRETRLHTICKHDSYHFLRWWRACRLPVPVTLLLLGHDVAPDCLDGRPRGPNYALSVFLGDGVPVTTFARS